MKGFIVVCSMVIVVASYLMFYPNSKENVVNLLDYRNPYSRKPASIAAEVEDADTKEKISFELRDRLTGLQKLKKCLTVECDYKNEDSRQYELSVGNALKKELLDLYEEVLKSERVDTEIESVALEFLKVRNGHVKEAALLLLSTQPPSHEGLNSIVEDIIEYHDPNLIGLAMIELEKYQDSKYQDVIRNSFIRNFKTGSLLVKEVMAKGIHRFVDTESRSQFESIVKNLPVNSKVRRNLQSSLDRYDSQNRL